MTDDPRGYDETKPSDQPAMAETAVAQRPATREPRLREGDQIARYRIRARLGAGGMGVAYKAHDPDLNRDVAIKVLRSADKGSEPRDDLQRRLLREAQAMAQLSHPNLVTVYDVGKFRGQVFVAMEFLEGGSLKEVFADRTRSWRSRLRFVIEAGRGLAEAHGAGVIHRDFKPENVFVSRSGRAQVGDFGLARAAIELAQTQHSRDIGVRDELTSQLTQTGAIMGTPAYMSPEQHRGAAADARSDQFSFAVTAFEALYGFRPFAGDDLESIARAVLAGEVTAPPKDTGVPRAVHEVVLRALSTDPADRFPSMTALLDELEGTTRKRRGLSSGVVASAAIILVAGAIGAAFVIARDDRKSSPAAQSSVLDAMQSSAPTATQDRDRQAISRAIDKRRLDLEGCFRRDWRQNPTATGAADIRLEVDADGRVANAEVVSHVGMSEDAAKCLRAHLGQWDFDPTESGTAITMHLPIDMTPGPTAGIETNSNGTYDVHRGVLSRLAAEPDVLASGGRIVPTVKDGKPIGFRLFAIQPGSLYAALGLRSGDTLVGANGTKLATADEVLAAYAKLREANEIRLSVMRAGKPLEIVLRMHD